MSTTPTGTPLARHLAEAWDEVTAPGSGFATEEVEVRGIPMRVFSSAPPSLRAVWEGATLHGDKPYIVFEDERLTYTEAAGIVRSLAHLLVDEHGVGRGDRVAISMRNYPEWVLSFWAVVAVGAAPVGMNAWWTTAEMDFALRDSAPKVLIADEERIERVAPIIEEIQADQPLALIGVRTEGDLPGGGVHWGDVVRPEAAPAALPDIQIDPDDDSTVFYTSGTTGTPKGAQITHRGAVHNILHLVFFTMVSAVAEAKAIAAGDLPAPEPAPEGAAPAGLVYMAPTPLFHVTACNCVLHPVTLAGGTVVLMYKWDAGRALELIEREGVTNLSGVPTMSRELLAHPDWATRDTSTLKGMGGGGAPLQPDLVEKIDSSLPKGAPSTGYGLTETSGIVTANTSSFYLEKPASCGRVVPTLDAKLVGADGEEVPPGSDEVGELCVRGPVVIKGYLNRPEATAESIPEGWFHTGDIARIDSDGFVTLVDRAKDMVLRGGENVYCAEVEAAIYEHDDVAEVAVFGLPEERLGEEVSAVVVVRPGATVTVEELQAFTGERIARHKVPTTLIIREDPPLPRNANGKFVKRQLAEEMAKDRVG